MEAVDVLSDGPLDDAHLLQAGDGAVARVWFDLSHLPVESAAGTDGDGLAAEMNTPERRRSHIAAFYSHRFWHGHYEFSREEIDFFTELFADAQKFRASYGLYECNFSKRPISDMVRFFEPVPTPTLILYGPEDHIFDERLMRRCEIAYPDHAGPFVAPGAGHFLQ